MPALAPVPAGADPAGGAGRGAIGLTHESSIAPERLVTLVTDYLAEAPPAWDPFGGGPLSRSTNHLLVVLAVALGGAADAAAAGAGFRICLYS